MKKTAHYHTRFINDTKALKKDHKYDEIKLALTYIRLLTAGKDIPPGQRKGPLRDMKPLLHARVDGDLRFIYYAENDVHAVFLCGHDEMQRRSFDPADLEKDWGIAKWNEMMNKLSKSRGWQKHSRKASTEAGKVIQAILLQETHKDED